MEHAHHSHGAGTEFIERLLSRLPISPSALEFLSHFLFDFITIMLLFFIITAAVSYFSSFPALSRVRDKIKSSSGTAGYFIALAAGILSPFCSCTIIPVFAGLLAFGVPTGYLFTFLTSASMLNLSVLISLFIWAENKLFFFAYLGCAIIISVLSGALPWVCRLNGDGVPSELCGCECSCGHHHEHSHDAEHKGHEKITNNRFAHCIKDTMHMLGEVFPWILVSVAVSSALTYLTPNVIPWLGATSKTALPVAAALIGLPVHPDIFSVLPFLKMFFAVSPCSGFVFLLFALSFSIPGTLLLLKIIKPRAVFKYSLTVLALAFLLSAAAVFVL